MALSIVPSSNLRYVKYPYNNVCRRRIELSMYTKYTPQPLFN